MKKHGLILLYWIIFCTISASPLKVVNLTCEYMQNPLGIDVRNPMLGWQLQSDERGTSQSAYEIWVATDSSQLNTGKGLVWKSGKVRSSENANLVYAGKGLRPFTRYYWKVRAYDGEGAVSAWSETAWWETALLAAEDWKAEWIYDGSVAPEEEADFYKDNPAPMFRKVFEVKDDVKSARLYIAGLGYYEASLNGERVGDHWLDPGWTNYAKEILYSTYDVTYQLKKGDNCIGVLLGNGFYNPIPMPIFRNLREYLTIGQPCLKAQLRIVYRNGKTETIVSDTDWKYAESPIRRNNVYLGEHYDARKEKQGWNTSAYQEKPEEWKDAVLVQTPPEGNLIAQLQPPVRVREIIRPQRMTETRPGEFVFDMGQNFAGVVRIKVKGERGTQIKIRYGEDVYSDGSLNIMTSVAGQHKTVWNADWKKPGAPPTAWQEDSYTLKGEGEEIWTPRFTFHGFRYIEITGWPGQPDLESVEGLRLSADLQQSGTFSCSDPMLSRLHQVLDYTFLSNVFSVESDCPAREKFGYGGDIVGVSRTFCYFYNMHNFYQKAIRDFANDQRPSGGFPETAPYNGIADQGLGDGSGPIGWQLAFAFLQKQLYMYYGDIRIVRQFYPQLKKQVDFLRAQAKDYLIDRCINDHESLDERIPALFATAHFYHHALLITEFARLLNYADDEKLYADLALHIKEAFIRNFVSADGQIGNGTPAEQAFGLYYGLVPEDKKEAVGEKLIVSIAERDYHVTSGIFGVPAVLTVLGEMGREDIAWRMVTQKDFPGWGHMLNSGATTLWETWKYSDNVYSQNHPMFGSVGEWLYQSVGGIQAMAPGFKEFQVKPFLTKELEWMNCRYKSVYGEIRSEWTLDNGCYILRITVPVNTQAKVYLPAQAGQITEGNVSLREAKGIRVVDEKSNSTCVEVPSGVYSFRIPIPVNP